MQSETKCQRRYRRNKRQFSDVPTRERRRAERDGIPIDQLEELHEILSYEDSGETEERY